MDAIHHVVVVAKIVCPILGAVNIVTYRVLKLTDLGVVDVERGRPCLGSVVIGVLVAEVLILIGFPTVSGVSDDNALVVGVVLKDRVDLISVAVLVAESLNGYGSGAKHVGGGVILAVVVVPEGLAVRDILDSISGVVAGDDRLPELLLPEDLLPDLLPDLFEEPPVLAPLIKSFAVSFVHVPS